MAVGTRSSNPLSSSGQSGEPASTNSPYRDLLASVKYVASTPPVPTRPGAPRTPGRPSFACPEQDFNKWGSLHFGATARTRRRPLEPVHLIAVVGRERHQHRGSDAGIAPLLDFADAPPGHTECNPPASDPSSI